MSRSVSLDTSRRTKDHHCYAVPEDAWSLGDAVRAAGIGVAGISLLAGAGMATTGAGAPAGAATAVSGALAGGAIWLVGAALDGFSDGWNRFNGTGERLHCEPLARGMQNPNPARAGVSLRAGSAYG